MRVRCCKYHHHHHHHHYYHITSGICRVCFLSNYIVFTSGKQQLRKSYSPQEDGGWGSKVVGAGGRAGLQYSAAHRWLVCIVNHRHTDFLKFCLFFPLHLRSGKSLWVFCFCQFGLLGVCNRHRERQTETYRQTDWQRDGETETDRQRQTDRLTDWLTERRREADRHRQREQKRLRSWLLPSYLSGEVENWDLSLSAAKSCANSRGVIATFRCVSLCGCLVVRQSAAVVGFLWSVVSRRLQTRVHSALYSAKDIQCVTVQQQRSRQICCVISIATYL